MLIFLLNPNFLLVHQNRYSEGMYVGQKTPRGHPDFNSYVKILRVFIDNRQTNRQADRQTEIIIRCGLGNLIGSSSFFILKKQLNSQDMFLVRSELSINAYLFLVLYRSTPLKSLSFLKNIETFLCK